MNINIEKDINDFLAASGWSVSRLAKAAGIAIPIVSRLKNGRRKGLTLDTFLKLHPILYGDNPHQQASGER